jgi:hypothetical protein
VPNILSRPVTPITLPLSADGTDTGVLLARSACWPALTAADGR